MQDKIMKIYKNVGQCRTKSKMKDNAGQCRTAYAMQQKRDHVCYYKTILNIMDGIRDYKYSNLANY